MTTMAKKAPEAASIEHIQRPPAEVLHAAELAALATEDAGAQRPDGWRLTPRSVLRFILGDPKLGIARKFVGERAFLERSIVALATNRGLMLVGEPGTAKSWLSELLAAAISGDSTLTIQGSAGTTEDAIRYSWNYALLVAEGPSLRALVPAPLHRGMSDGKLVRFEEITRCPVEIQDTLLSVLSDRVLLVPELAGAERTVFARAGFNVIATANLKDRGVNEMSAALKRRFNFETVVPISDLAEELDLVKRETERLFEKAAIPTSLPGPVLEVLVTCFRELRTGKTESGEALEPLSTAMSTAEAIGVGFTAGAHAHYFEGREATPEHIVHALIGSAFKDSADDLKKLRSYFNHVAKARKAAHWEAFHAARKLLP
jgi:MoxR-like ATPase